MNNDQISPSDVKIHPNNKNLTMPRSYGVWELSSSSKGKKYRFGNNPIREIELLREFGSAKLIALYLNRDNAVQRANELNNL